MCMEMQQQCVPSVTSYLKKNTQNGPGQKVGFRSGTSLLASSNPSVSSKQISVQGIVGWRFVTAQGRVFPLCIYESPKDFLWFSCIEIMKIAISDLL